MAPRYDIVVVGAGIMGVASAYYLQKNNPTKRVLVVERYRGAGQGNTGRSNGMFRNTFTSSDNQILTNGAIDFYDHVQQGLGVDIGLKKIGYLWLMDDGQLSRSEEYLQRMERNGVETTRYSREELRQRLPGLVAEFGSNEEAKLMNLPPVDGAIFGPKCGSLDPDKLVGYYASEFTKAGGTFQFNADVESLVIGPSERLGIDGEPFVWQDSEVEGVSIRGRSGEVVEAETVVVAGGAWANELLEPIGVDGHVKAKKRQLFSVQPSGTKLAALVHAGGFNPLRLVPMIILPKAGAYFRPKGDEECLWVGCEDEVNRPYIDLPHRDVESYLPERDYYEKSVFPLVSSYFPDFRESTVKAMWAGLYAYNTVDNLPFAFRKQNLIVVGGDSGSGIMKGDSLGRIVDAVYRGEEETELYGGTPYRTSKLGFDQRDVEREEWVI